MIIPKLRMPIARRWLWLVVGLPAIWWIVTGIHPVAAASLSVTPEADAYVDSSQPTVNFGSSTQIRVDNSPIVNAYLRFTVAGLTSPVTLATLRIYANSSSSAGYVAYTVADNTWTETTLNYSNAPATGSSIGSSGAASSGTWTSVDVTQYVTGNGTYSLALKTTSSTALSLGSRESGANSPQLVISTGTTAPTPTATALQAATATRTATPTRTATRTRTPTRTRAPNAGPTATATAVPPPATNTPTPVPLATNTPTPVPLATNTPTAAPLATNTPTATPLPANTPTATALATNTPTPTAAPSSGQDPIIVAAGDIACDPTYVGFNNGNGTTTTCHMLATSNMVLNINPAGVLTLGDNQYSNGALAEFQASFDLSWGRFKGLIRPAPGNHEYGTLGAAGYFSYFGAAAGLPSQGYYSFDIGGWHLVALNSECSQIGGCSASAPQATWLRADLAANPGKCVLAYWHRPRFSSGQHGGSTSYIPLWQALYDYRGDIVLGAHDHDYERFDPQDPNGAADPNGLREFIVGTGGDSYYTFATVQPNNAVRNSGAFGLLQLTLHPHSYDWQFVPERGQTFTDSGSATCHN